MTAPSPRMIFENQTTSLILSSIHSGTYDGILCEIIDEAERDSLLHGFYGIRARQIAGRAMRRLSIITDPMHEDVAGGLEERA